MKPSVMMILRSETSFATRLDINHIRLEQTPVTKMLGVWISDDLSWTKNCKEISIKAYSRLSMLTKLKYVGVSVEDLLDVYKLFIRSCVEYCSVAFHSTLTLEQSAKLEQIQKTCLRVILSDMYISYSAAMEMTGLETLHTRREKRCLNFALKCLKNEKMSKMFPLKLDSDQEIRNREIFIVNQAKTSSYQKSAIPYCQRKLNKHFSKTTK